MSDTSDRRLLDLIRRQGPLTVAAMVDHLGVTPTAIRNRLTRLVASGLVERRAESGGRGRPKHTYRASEAAQQALGQNYADLAVALWEELMRDIEDPKLRRFLFGRVTDRLADLYGSQVQGEAWQGRMVQLGELLHGRGIEAEVADEDGLSPVLRQHSCPYHALAELDRTICALERKMFEKVLGHGLRLSQCRLDGHRSCDFEAKPLAGPAPASNPTPAA